MEEYDQSAWKKVTRGIITTLWNKKTRRNKKATASIQEAGLKGAYKVADAAIEEPNIDLGTPQRWRLLKMESMT